MYLRHGAQEVHVLVGNVRSTYEHAYSYNTQGSVEYFGMYLPVPMSGHTPLLPTYGTYVRTPSYDPVPWRGV